jgi:Fic family protein
MPGRASCSVDQLTISLDGGHHVRVDDAAYRNQIDRPAEHGFQGILQPETGVPFDDGNARIARAVGDLFLARADGSPQRFYSLSAQIQRERKSYYDILERTQKQSLDVTEWLAWFLDTLHRAVDQAQHALDAVLTKTRFWQRWAAPTSAPLTERQLKLLNRLLDGFEGKLTSSKWVAIAKCSPDTALRDITDLLARGVLRKSDAGGRSTRYELNDASK